MVVFRAALTAAAAAALLTFAAPAQSTPQPAPPSVATSAAQNPHARRIAQIIQNVEAAYQNGMSNYQDGHLAAAKSNFDYAVDQMLTCGLSIKDNPDLAAEFDRIVDAVNTLELDALKQGNGLAPPADPTPVDVANAVTFPVDPAIRAEATAQLKTTRSDLPLVMNDAVASYINFFSKSKAGHGTIVASLDRAGRYKDMIERVLKQEGVPQDLIYQAVAESGFRTQVVNRRSGAGGMWQFMPGDDHAPPRSAWYDERFDPIAATRAYAEYMKYLYSQFGDWYLAMAAYDWGAGNVQKAVQRTGFADFWELYKRNNLPAETKNYVPIILAVTIMAKNPKQYGLDDLTPDPPLVEDTVQTNHSVGLALAGDLVGASPQELAALNPSLLRGTTPPDETFNLHLPAGTKALFEKRIAGIPADKRRYWRYHTLAPNETPRDVARSYHVSVAALEDANQVSSASGLDDLDALIIPVTPRTASLGASFYRVRRGDTLITIADRFNVSVAQLRAWNHLRGSIIRAGHRLRVAAPAHIPSRRRRSHRRSTHHATRHTTKKSSSAKTKSASRHASSHKHK